MIALFRHFLASLQRSPPIGVDFFALLYVIHGHVGVDKTPGFAMVVSMAS